MGEVSVKHWEAAHWLILLRSTWASFPGSWWLFCLFLLLLLPNIFLLRYHLVSRVPDSGIYWAIRKSHPVPGAQSQTSRAGTTTLSVKTVAVPSKPIEPNKSTRSPKHTHTQSEKSIKNSPPLLSVVSKAGLHKEGSWHRDIERERGSSALLLFHFTGDRLSFNNTGRRAAREFLAQGRLKYIARSSSSSSVHIRAAPFCVAMTGYDKYLAIYPTVTLSEC